MADSPSRDLQQHRRSPQVQACRRAYHYHLATVQETATLSITRSTEIEEIVKLKLKQQHQKRK